MDALLTLATRMASILGPKKNNQAPTQQMIRISDQYSLWQSSVMLVQLKSFDVDDRRPDDVAFSLLDSRRPVPFVIHSS